MTTEQEAALTRVTDRRDGARPRSQDELAPPLRWLYAVQDTLEAAEMPGRRRQRVLAVAKEMTPGPHPWEDVKHMYRGVDIPAVAHKYGISAKLVCDALYWLTDNGWLVIVGDDLAYWLIFPRPR
jgi:hypothetical protein